jgi:CheY-like chemotaxis protein
MTPENTKILVVEDEVMLREEISEMLRFEGYQVITAHNGALGLETAQKELPDLILSDIMMPMLDGYGMLLRLREDPRTHNIPLIFLTAKASYSDVRKGMIYGADDYLVKPFRIRDLLDSVATRLRKHEEAERTRNAQIDRLRRAVVTSFPHELRTPLTGIMGYVELILGDFESLSPEQVQRMLQGLQRSAGRLYHLIENYILYTQLEFVGVSAERQTQLRAYIEFPPSDPAILIPALVERKAEAHGRKEDVTVQLMSAPVAMLPEDLLKITEELVDNAFKFSVQGTPVKVIGEPYETDYRLQVIDQGRGMSEEQIGQIGGLIQFGRDIHEQQGMGLGLAIVRRVCEMYGVDLKLTSEFRVGVQATLLLRRMNV